MQIPQHVVACGFDCDSRVGVLGHLGDLVLEGRKKKDKSRTEAIFLRTAASSLSGRDETI